MLTVIIFACALFPLGFGQYSSLPRSATESNGQRNNPNYNPNLDSELRRRFGVTDSTPSVGGRYQNGSTDTSRRGGGGSRRRPTTTAPPQETDDEMLSEETTPAMSAADIQTQVYRHNTRPPVEEDVDGRPTPYEHRRAQGPLTQIGDGNQSASQQLHTLATDTRRNGHVEPRSEPYLRVNAHSRQRGGDALKRQDSDDYDMQAMFGITTSTSTTTLPPTTTVNTFDEAYGRMGLSAHSMGGASLEFLQLEVKPGQLGRRLNADPTYVE
jgi:hypothetical protein